MKNKKFMRCSLIAILIFIFYMLLQPSKNIATFSLYSPTPYKINKSLIQSLDKNPSPMRNYAEKEAITLVLDIINYPKWKDFLDYIHMEIYYGNVIPGLSDELILSLNLSKDLGVIAIFEETDDHYTFHSKIENLAYIKEIKLIQHPTENKDLLLAYQIMDERLGAFFQEKFLEIFNYHEADFRSVWKKTIFYEEIYKENWVNINAPDHLWNKVIEETEIDFLYVDSLKINTITSLKKYEAYTKETPAKADFSLKEESSYSRNYYWSDEYQTFILGEITRDVFISNMALLDDLEDTREKVFGIINPYYKLSTTRGEILYLPKDKFRGLFKNILK